MTKAEKIHLTGNDEQKRFDEEVYQVMRVAEWSTPSEVAEKLGKGQTMSDNAVERVAENLLKYTVDYAVKESSGAYIRRNHPKKSGEFQYRLAPHVPLIMLMGEFL